MNMGVEPLDQLVGRARAADTPAILRQAAFGVLVERFQDATYSYAYGVLGDPHLAWDVVQESFLTAYGSLDQLRTLAAFPGWLRRIVRTHCRRLQRGSQPLVASLDAVDRGALLSTSRLDAQADPALIAERRERRAAIALAMRTLPAGQRAVAVLFYMCGYPQKDIAEQLSVPVTTVKKRLQAARKHLQARTVNVMDEDPQYQSSAEGAPPGQGKLLRMACLLTAVADADCEDSVLELLLGDGCDVKTTSANGRTLLSWAAQRGQVGTIAFLLRQGGQVNARDRAGLTPLAWAERTHRHEAAALLRHSGGMRRPRRR